MGKIKKKLLVLDVYSAPGVEIEHSTPSAMIQPSVILGSPCGDAHTGLRIAFPRRGLTSSDLYHGGPRETAAVRRVYGGHTNALKVAVIIRIDF